MAEELNPQKKGRCSFFNFILMFCVGFILLDLPGMLLSIIPGMGFLITVLSNMIFIPWFYLSGMKFTNARLLALGATTVLEWIPLIGILPLISLSIVVSYYSNGK